jgi:hypothetical protein
LAEAADVKEKKSIKAIAKKAVRLMVFPPFFKWSPFN